MKKNLVALTVYRSVKAANDEESSAVSETDSAASYLQPLAGRGGWDPFEVWRTRIHVVVARNPRGKR